MKISLYVSSSDLILEEESLTEKFNRIIDNDEKHDLFRTKSTDQILKSLKKAGVNGIELLATKSLTDVNIEKIKNLIKKHKLLIHSIHQSTDNFNSISLSQIENLCKIANKFSAQVIVLHSDTIGDNLFDLNFISQLKKLQKKYNLKFGVENMPKSPFSLFKTYTYNPEEFSLLINKAGLYMTLDTTHLGQVQADLCKFYENNKEKIVNIHLSDYKNNWLNEILLLANDTHLPLGEGKLPIVKFLKILKQEKYAGVITMEINANLNVLCKSAEIIKKGIK
jgi:sugar phosphate isomerase/epimerase